MSGAYIGEVGTLLAHLDSIVLCFHGVIGSVISVLSLRTSSRTIFSFFPRDEVYSANNLRGACTEVVDTKGRLVLSQL